MDKLSNSFSLLELESEDSKGESSIATKEQTDSDKRIKFFSEDGTLLNNENGNQKQIPSELRMPLVWIDLEMTALQRSCLSESRALISKKCLQIVFILSFHVPGLNIEVDRILEIACVVTDGNLTKSIEGPDLVIHQTKECLDKMGEWCQEHHAESGLTEKVLQSTINEQDAEKQVIEFVKRYVGTYTSHIAGNSVYTDLLFLKRARGPSLGAVAPSLAIGSIMSELWYHKYMPDLAALFSHVLVDVSSVNALCTRWYPRDKKKAPRKENKHRALDDIKESIAELKFYKEHIFKPKSKK
ncbi:hypothetical protein CASFOL_030309 [Castilleja foliolosa]|uniref:Exonuclease domain-containing protein n=1 Tax=Castilleja foliolosa TaxID=1961234 RepID=A0ABD3CAF8_9LAMI